MRGVGKRESLTNYNISLRFAKSVFICKIIISLLQSSHFEFELWNKIITYFLLYLSQVATRGFYFFTYVFSIYGWDIFYSYCTVFLPWVKKEPWKGLASLWKKFHLIYCSDNIRINKRPLCKIQILSRAIAWIFLSIASHIKLSLKPCVHHIKYYNNIDISRVVESKERRY